MSDDDQQALRAEALESLLVERGLLDPAAVDEVIVEYNERVGPMNGARVVARAWKDPQFRALLLSDGTAGIAALGLGGAQTEKLVVVENTPEVHNLVVCTLCSCYPWAVLGLPPKWYKDPAYRSRVVREPRRVLAEFGTQLDPGTRIQVWDSSAEVRYMVLPQPPAGWEALSEEALTECVTRDAMIGVTLL
jgi:nitrile hydratase